MTAEGDDLVVQANKGEGFHISTAVRDRVLNSGLSVLVRDTSIDDARSGSGGASWNSTSGTLMAVPLQTRGQDYRGIIYVDSPSLLREFSKDDLNLLTVMANVAANRIETTRFAEVEQARQLLWRAIWSRRRKYSRVFCLLWRRWCAAWTWRDTTLRAGQSAAITTISFPMAAAALRWCWATYPVKRACPLRLLMMGLQARVQVLIEEAEEPGGGDDAAESDHIRRNCPPNRFISLFFCILDGDTGEITFCNAGHNPPVIVRANGNYEQLKGGGPVLGILPTIDYKEHQAKLEEGDGLIIYSDGVTEANNPEGDEFEIEGLAKAVIEVRSLAAKDVIRQINEALVDYTAGAPQSDDITLIVARRVGG